ncbi:caspase domain-containing protein [Armillaria fumosa]|nr:caspase domain-containing protein [Armillaria fumosa]
MFLSWFNTTVGAVSDKIRYLISSLPCPTKLHGATLGAGAEKNPSFHESSPPEPEPSLSPLSSPSQSFLTERPTPSLFALVIGIDKYMHCSEQLKNLHGAVADADAVKAYLLDTLDIPEHRIKTLRNEEATRVTIEEEIKNLGRNPEITKDDPILIFYAGHGGETPKYPDSIEMIQMLVPHDFIPSGSGNAQEGQGVLDAKLNRLLEDLAKKKSDNITVILDCCHSGSGTRTHDSDPTFAVRGIDLPKTYTIAQDLLRDIESDSRTSNVPTGFQTAGLLSHVLLAACKQGQEAREACGRGAFTKALLDLLQDPKGIDKLTYKDVVANLHPLPKQDPQCEGVHQSRFIFNSKVTSSQHTFRHRITASPDSPDEYILKAGEAHGITTKAEFVVFPDNAITSTALGTVVAVKTTASTTTCKMARDNETPFSLDTSGGFASQIWVDEGQDIRLFFEEDERLRGIFPQTAEMKIDKAGKRGFRSVENRDSADLVVAADGDFVHFEVMDELCRHHGLTHMPFKVNIDDSNTIRRILQSSSDFYWHLNRSSKKGPLDGKVKVECLKLTGAGEYTDDLEEILEPDPNGHDLNVGGVISVDVDEEAIYGYKITNTSSAPLYVSMFYFDISSLSIDPYYQPGSAQQAADVSLPPKGLLTIGYGTSGTVPHMYTVPNGQNVDVGFLKLFISTEYLDLSGVVQESPFTESDATRTNHNRQTVTMKGLWHTMRVAIVQKGRVCRDTEAGTPSRAVSTISI